MEILHKNKFLKYNKREDVVKLREYIINSFKKLEFKEDTHQYFLNGEEFDSVSNVCHKFKRPFNKELKAQECFEKYYNDINSKYYQMTTKQILQEWNSINKNACSNGHIKHSFGEDVFYLLTEQYDKISRELINGNLIPQDKEENNIVKFWNDLPINYIPLLSECRGYLENSKIAGTFDNLFVIDNGDKLSQRLFLSDYKTNKNIFNQFQDEMLLYPFEDLPADNFHIYTIQLNIYQLFLESIKCKVIGRRLVYLRGDNYSIYKLQDITKKLKKVL